MNVDSGFVLTVNGSKCPPPPNPTKKQLLLQSSTIFHKACRVFLKLPFQETWLATTGVHGGEDQSCACRTWWWEAHCRAGTLSEPRVMQRGRGSQA